MNWLISRIEKWFINKQFLFFFLFIFSSSPLLSWDVDLSRRVKNTESVMADELRWPSSLKPAEELFSDVNSKKIFSSLEASQSIAVLLTENGFVPDTLRLRLDGNYKIVIANVNEKNKNTSFIMDSFGQTHGTYFGKPKNFELNPKTNGIFTFICPETGAQGKVIVYSDKETSPSISLKDQNSNSISSTYDDSSSKKSAFTNSSLMNQSKLPLDGEIKK